MKEHFKVRYVLLNNLQDFLAVRLVWTPDGQCVSAISVWKVSFNPSLMFSSNVLISFKLKHLSVCSGRGQGEDSALSAVVCHTPLSNLGHCRKGSTLSFSVAFQILKPGLYEVCPTEDLCNEAESQPECKYLLTLPPLQLSQHMKLKLQFTASVSNPPPDARPLSRKHSLINLSR